MNNGGCIGCAVMLLIIVGLVALYQVRTVREGVSTAWRYTTCHIKFCDDEGRCPVWASERSRCEMLSTREADEYEQCVSKPCKADDIMCPKWSWISKSCVNVLQ